MLTDADLAAWKEHLRIQKFVAACQRQWPGAMIVLRPNGASSDAEAPFVEPEPASGAEPMSDDFDDTPTEADLDSCYGSRFLATTDIGDQKIRTRIARVRKETMQARDGKPARNKFIIHFATLDKAMVLNATNKNILVDSHGRDPKAWINTEVGIYVDPNVQFAGKVTKGLRLRVLNKPVETAPKPPPKASSGDPFDDLIPGFDQPA